MTRPAPQRRQVRSGLAELVPDRFGTWTLRVDGVAQSTVNLTEPSRLDLPYLRQMAAVLDCVAPADAAPRIMHLGGGALSLPRYVAATRPGATQLVVERDGALDAWVREVLPVPLGIVTRVDDARTAVEDAADAAWDVVIGDVYQAAVMPTRVASVEFAREVARALTDAGTYVVNVIDLPPLTLCRVYAATLRAVFDDVCLVGDPAMLRGRRYGNVVLAAARTLDVERLRRRLGRTSRVLHGSTLDAFVMGTGPMVDA